MNKNFFKEIAKILNIKIDETFTIKEKGEFKLTKDGLRTGKGQFAEDKYLVWLISGKYVIERKWKPKIKQIYYFPNIDKGENKSKYYYTEYCNDLIDKEREKDLLICKTSEEAIKLSEIALKAIKEYREKGV